MEGTDAVFDLCFKEILELASSRSHVPGGGSVAAMSAALGASMGAMVANLTVGKKGCEESRGEAEGTAAAFGEGIAELEELTRGDMSAFDGLLLAYRLPKATDDERKARAGEILKRSAEAALAPLRISAKAAELLKLNRRLAEFGNPSAVNDCAVAAVILEASGRAAMLSVDVNLPALDDPVMLKDIKDRRASILGEAEAAMLETLDIVARRNKPL
ncbi:MAG: cyclodeaminase/cyclohydrolase family protein [Deltaproteobacteria bacterium]|jgi:formiminotetrahydrofolate cyclodeaminase|nr:cyclodeaminase/cyclohydrolase family protein [Deltaproteobacteria bacterium]